ncbi:hypothetical protein M9Y10_013873 [Tritrichomonas musculus]|uniref:Uncharacterized protein n=1 Tax=Tritrichomonas musculus TaxID=1915356 RepID=A0ABR2KY05_9EUKA
MQDIIKDYERVFGKKITVKDIQDEFPKYKEAVYKYRIIILKQELIQNGYTDDEISKLIQSTDEQTYIKLNNEKSKTLTDLNRLMFNQEILKYFQDFKKETKSNIFISDLFKKLNHSSDAVIFYLTWFQYNKRNIEDVKKKRSHQEMLAHHKNDYAKGVFDMQQEINLYDRRKELFESQLGQIMRQYNVTFENLMENEALKTHDIEKDLERAKAVFDNRTDKEKYLDYLQQIGEEDNSYINYDAFEQRKYFKKKIKEIETNKKTLTNKRFDELFGYYQTNHPTEHVSEWYERYIWAKKIKDPIDLKKTENKLELDYQIISYNRNYPDNPWDKEKNSSLTDEAQLQLLRKINDAYTFYETSDLNKAIDEYNKVFKTNQVNLPEIIDKWGKNTDGAKYELLRKARVEEAKRLLGKNFNEDDYDENDEGLELLKSVIEFEKSKRFNFSKGEETFKDALDAYNEYFKSQGAARDIHWVKHEFESSKEKAKWGLQIYVLIDEINQFHEPAKYNRQDIRGKILDSTDNGESLYNKLIKEKEALTKEKEKFEKYAKEKEFQDSLEYWNQQHGSELNEDSALRILGVFQQSTDPYPRANKAYAELLLFY